MQREQFTKKTYTQTPNRDSKHNTDLINLLKGVFMEIENTAELIDPENDDKLVNEAFEKIKEIYFKHAATYNEDIAKYLIETFFDSDIELIRRRTPAMDKKESFFRVLQKLKEEDPRLPGKSWAYNLLRLKVQEHDYQADTELFQTYGKLSLSHKTELLKIADSGEKRQLINEACENNYSVRDLKKKISEIRPQKTKKKKPLALPKCIENIKSKIEEWKTLFVHYKDMGPLQDDEEKILYKIEELERVINNIRI